MQSASEHGSTWLFETEVKLESDGTTQVDIDASDVSDNGASLDDYFYARDHLVSLRETMDDTGSKQTDRKSCSC